MKHDLMTWLRWTSLVDGISLLILVGIGVPLKYVGDNDMIVRIVGPIHGGIWIALLVLLGVALWKRRIQGNDAMVVGICSVIPFAPFVIDRRLRAISAPATTDSAQP